jgi:CRISPR-associated protein Cas2
MRTTFLICYDISDEKRLRRVFKICKDYGSHLQYSVFESDLSQVEKTELEPLVSKIRFRKK